MAGRKSAKAATVLGVAITHPDKVLWPKSKFGAAVTKLDLARYYAAVADRMLAHIAERPISIVRAPDGIAGGKFFQRHALPGSPSIKIKGQSKPFLSIGSAHELVGLAQVAALEIHPWGSAKRNAERPARIVFDLDPAPALPFDSVIDAAQELRVRLTRLGLAPFVKTTGGKGLHVVIALAGETSWAEAKDFARAFAKAAEHDAPDRYTTSMAKSARRGKIFIDYLRNDRMATSVAPWSPRARPGAPIALPLSWSQVRHGFDPHHFTISSADSLLRNPDPWKGLTKSARSVAPALRKLQKRAQESGTAPDAE
jgi:bifunctional non-homologous end joining protein LigD